MRSLNRVVKIIIISVCITLFVVLVSFLIRLTRKYEARKRINDLRDVLTEYISENGEKSLLELAGVPVDKIYYENEFTPLYQGDKPAWKLSEEELTSIYVYNKCSDAIVFISDSNLHSGSGYFISEDGYISTNYHVISSLENITVITSDEKEYSAQVVGYDEENDIALLKINSDEKFNYLNISSSNDLYVGQSVYIIGNPFGYTRSISKGIISALGREVRDLRGNVVLGMIQTDAVINFGNSGGPLLNTFGEVIGMASSIYRSTELSEGLNFCLSSETILESIKILRENGAVNRGWMDFYGVQLNKNIVDFASLKISNGILVSSVLTGGKADNAGLRGGSRVVEYGSNKIRLGGDIITQVNGTKISTFDDLFTVLSQTIPGDIAEVIVYRNGTTVRLKIELVERTDDLMSHIII